jgi:hypothetical protein
MAAQSILSQINSSNYTDSITTIYKPPLGHSGFVTTLRLTIDLNSIEPAEFPYFPDDTPPAVLQQMLNEIAANTEYKEIILYFKKGNGSWLERCSLQIFNKEPFYDINLMRIFSDANTIDVAEDFSLGIQVKVGNTLAATDRILIWGSVVEEKKNNGNEELAAAIEALQLAIYGRLTDLSPGTLLGRNAGTGIVEQIPQSTFAKSTDVATAINAAINALVAGAPGALNTLDELSAALADNPNFAATIVNELATKVSKVGNEEISGNKNFTGFTALGNIGTKQQIIINFTSPSNTSNTLVAANLPAPTKIISITGMIQATSGDWFPPNHYGGSMYANTKLWSLYTWNGNAFVSLHADAIASMGGRTGGKLFITYIE